MDWTVARKGPHLVHLLLLSLVLRPGASAMRVAPAGPQVAHAALFLNLASTMDLFFSVRRFFPRVCF